MAQGLRRIAVAASALLILAGSATAEAETLVYQATTSGQQALDQDEKGGNPFASALIDALAQSGTGLPELSQSLRRLTLHYSKGRQTPQVPDATAGPLWKVAPAEPGEQRIALVLVFSDYGKAGVQSLPGAKLDAERIAAALRRAGFEAEVAIDLDRGGVTRKLAAFAEASRTKDAAVIYTTGHGVEVEGKVYLIPADYPISERNRALAARAIPLPRIAEAAQARTVNLVFYGGCRDNPLAE